MIDPSIPGADLVAKGLQDLERGLETPESLLTLIGAPRLRELGIDVPQVPVEFPEHQLYEVLAREHPGSAHSRYNALIRALVSFERASECLR